MSHFSQRRQGTDLSFLHIENYGLYPKALMLKISKLRMQSLDKTVSPYFMTLPVVQAEI